MPCPDSERSRKFSSRGQSCGKELLSIMTQLDIDQGGGALDEVAGTTFLQKEMKVEEADRKVGN